MKKIAVIGGGYVGKAVSNMFKGHYEVRVKDIDSYYSIVDGVTNEEYTYTKDGEADVWDKINLCDLSIIAVPTPMAEDGSCDTSIVEDVASKLETQVILIKSTVAPGTTDMLKKKYGKRVVFSPEYSGESTYWSPYKFDRDMKECPFVVLGGNPKDRQYVLDLIVPILGPKKKYFQCDSTEAELTKYFENAYFSVKVTYANEMKSICDAFNVDYYTVREAWALDPRVDPMHTMVFKNRNYSGKCLPKDISALIQASKKAGYEPALLEQVIKSNQTLETN